ncbi:hypothetical protein RRG08_066656 [Elysia crispata]|uniref:Uncharacterized protein n=1 Tax=Elysia crispata TaxID=231223 RepID=A0AAE1AAT7_9GAST|nr:hypothetical protein RRG08_066656 [Elysia crispata]
MKNQNFHYCALLIPEVFLQAQDLRKPNLAHHYLTCRSNVSKTGSGTLCRLPFQNRISKTSSGTLSRLPFQQSVKLVQGHYVACPFSVSKTNSGTLSGMNFQNQ